MDMNLIREYIVLDDEIFNILGSSVFLFEKPELSQAEKYIIYNFKEISGGNSIRDYQLDLKVVCKDKLSLFPIKDRLIEILDNFNKPTKIKDSNITIRSTRLINGGGIVKNIDSGEYNLLIYFLIKI